MAVFSADTSLFAGLLGLPSGSTAILTGSESSVAFSDASLANFAGSLSSPFLVLTSGIAAMITAPNIDGSQGVDLGLEGVTGDSVTITFTIPRPAGAEAISFDFAFLSEEIPEYIGSEFDDFLSIKINGVESALDPNGDRITVNNGYFDSPFSPEGTIFDGQTPTLTVIAPIGDQPDTVTVSIQVADVGDGLYDSAGFLSNFRFIEPQLVYLQFDGGEIDFDSFLSDADFSLPGSGLTAGQQDEIVDALNAIYSEFLIEFTKVEPDSGEYSTVHVGGSVADLPSYLEASARLLGRAEKIDYGNLDKSDSAFVLSGEFPLSNNQPDIALLSQVIAHEVGHILGLRHVAGGGELLQPFADSGNINIGGRSDLAEIDQTTNQVIAVGGVQDSRAELQNSIGPSELTEVIEADTVADRTLKLFSFDLPDATNPLFRSIVAVANTENEVLSFTEIGTITGGGVIEVLVPATDRDKVVLLAQSSETSGYDVFASSGTTDNFDVDSASEESVLNAFGVKIDDLDTTALELVQVGPDGELTSLGTITVFEVDADDAPATEGDDVLVGGQRVADTLLGLGGDDKVSGLGGTDRLFGNTGDDLLDGGGGDDYLSGGEGNDAFFFGPDARGRDEIVDFSDGDFLVTTTKLVDRNGDDIVDFGKNRILDLEFRSGVEITDDAGAAVNRLEFDGALMKDGNVYYVYSLIGSTADPELALLNL